MKNHYEIIGLSPSATQEQIKLAYTNAILRIQGQTDFAERFVTIQEAYDILSHSDTRKIFDKELRNFYTGKYTNHSKSFSQKIQSIKEELKPKINHWISLFRPKINFKKISPYFPYIALAVVIILIILGLRACNDNKPKEIDTTVLQERASPQAIPQESHDISTKEFGNNKSDSASSTDSAHSPTVDEIFHNPTVNISIPAFVDPITKDSLDLVKNGYLPRHIKNGGEPDCFNYTPQKSNVNNRLIVYVGYKTDVVVKLISQETEKCIRYFYIRGGSTYTIYGIPQGIYYLKLAYGKQWMMSNANGQCVGKFLRNAKYEIGKETLNYNFKYSDNRDGYRIPSFHLKLGISFDFDKSDNFRSDNISEERFNQ